MLMWNVEITDEYERWFHSLDDGEQVSVAQSIALLEATGPSLGRPHADVLRGSRHGNMKEH